MLLSPKKTKFSKSFSGRKKTTTIHNKISQPRFATLCLIAQESGIITNFQLESIRRFLRRYLKKKAQLFFRFFPNTPVTKKPNEVRLGRGKGNLKYWAFFITKGDIFIEVRSANNKNATFFLKAVRTKLPIKSFIFNRHSRWIF